MGRPRREAPSCAVYRRPGPDSPRTLAGYSPDTCQRSAACLPSSFYMVVICSTSILQLSNKHLTNSWRPFRAHLANTPRYRTQASIWDWTSHLLMSTLTLQLLCSYLIRKWRPVLSATCRSTIRIPLPQFQWITNDGNDVD